jgi:hypothetical protein
MFRYSLVTSSVIFSPLLRAAESQPAEHGKRMCAGILEQSLGARNRVGIRWVRMMLRHSLSRLWQLENKEMRGDM